MNQLPSPDRPQILKRAPATQNPERLEPVLDFVEDGTGSTTGGQSGAGPLDYWHILKRRRITIILSALLSMAAGFLFTVPQTPIYQARALVEIQGFNEDFMHMKDVNPNATQGIDASLELQTQVRILQSRSLIDRVVKKVTAQGIETDKTPGRLDAWRRLLHLSAPPLSSVTDKAISAAAEGLRVHAQSGTRLIEISCDSPDPRIAAVFANTLTSEFIEMSLEARWQSTEHTGAFLGAQMQDLKIKLEKSEDALQAYARANNLVITDEKQNDEEVKLKQLQEALSKAQAERIERQSRFELVTRASSDTLAEVLDDESMKDTQGKLTDLRRQSAELSSTLTPANPKIQKVQAQIASLDADLKQERVNILGRIRNDYEAAERREALLAADYGETAKTVASQADKVTHYNTLKREVDTNRQLYDSILQRVKEAGIASALRASNINVVDPAKVPGRPYKPNLAFNTLLGLVTGLVIGGCLVVVLEQADHSIQEPGDLALYLGIQELGFVPNASVDVSMRRSAAEQEREPNALVLVKNRNEPSAMAEAFRATLTSILFSNHQGITPQVLVITSAAPKEGKSTLTANLGLALAEIHKRVLVIDADLRRPSIHKCFGIEKNAGLVDLMRQPNPIVAPLNGHVTPTGVTNLSVITAGNLGSGAPTLLHSSRFIELMELVREEYDMILIDTPPMLNMSDARVIARHADGVILVARSSMTSRNSIRDAYRRFVDDRTRVVGAVLNAWDPRKSKNNGYYGYYDQYKSYYGKDERKG